MLFYSQDCKAHQSCQYGSITKENWTLRALKPSGLFRLQQLCRHPNQHMFWMPQLNCKSQHFNSLFKQLQTCRLTSSTCCISALQLLHNHSPAVILLPAGYFITNQISYDLSIKSCPTFYVSLWCPSHYCKHCHSSLCECVCVSVHLCDGEKKHVWL